MSSFILNMFKRWYLMCQIKIKTRIYAARAVKGLSVKHTNAIASVGFFKHTISSFPNHTSATTCAIGNAIFFKTVPFLSRRASRRPSRLTCGLTCSCCVGRRVGRRVGVWTVTRLSRLSSHPTSRA